MNFAMSGFDKQRRKVFGAEVYDPAKLLAIPEATSEELKKYCGVYGNTIIEEVLVTVVRGQYLGSTCPEVTKGFLARIREHARSLRQGENVSPVADSTHYRFAREENLQSNLRLLVLYEHDPRLKVFAYLMEAIMILLTNSLSSDCAISKRLYDDFPTTLGVDIGSEVGWERLNRSLPIFEKIGLRSGPRKSAIAKGTRCEFAEEEFAGSQCDAVGGEGVFARSFQVSGGRVLYHKHHARLQRRQALGRKAMTRFADGLKCQAEGSHCPAVYKKVPVTDPDFMHFMMVDGLALCNRCAARTINRLKHFEEHGEQKREIPRFREGERCEWDEGEGCDAVFKKVKRSDPTHVQFNRIDGQVFCWKHFKRLYERKNRPSRATKKLAVKD